VPRVWTRQLRYVAIEAIGPADWQDFRGRKDLLEEIGLSSSIDV